MSVLRIFFFSKYRVVLPLIQSSRFSLFSPSRLHPDQSNLHTHTHSHTHTTAAEEEEEELERAAATTILDNQWLRNRQENVFAR